MQLNLTDHEPELLRELLQDYLPVLKREVARTDEHALRHELVERQNRSSGCSTASVPARPDAAGRPAVQRERGELRMSTPDNAHPARAG